MTTTIDVIGPADLLPDDGPCTEPEARALVHKAASAAVQFEDAMREIFRRKAWEPLGYSNPQDLILGEFKDSLQNPRTGKPYGRAHIYRMARTALFLYEVASRTGVDAAELDIAEKALRAARANGVDDVAMLEQIEQKVIEASSDGPASSERVQDIIDDVVDVAAGRLAAQLADDDVANEVDTETEDGGQGGRGASGPPPPTSDPRPQDGESTQPTDTTDWPNRDPHPERETAERASNGAKPDPFDAFANQKAGALAPQGGTSWADAVASAGDFIDFTNTLRTITQLGELLPAVQDVESKLPEFLDACDDTELTAFSEVLDDVDLILADLPAIRSAVRAIQEAAQERAEEA